MQAFHGTFLCQEGAGDGLFTYLPVLELCGFYLNKLNQLFQAMLLASWVWIKFSKEFVLKTCFSSFQPSINSLQDAILLKDLGAYG